MLEFFFPQSIGIYLHGVEFSAAILASILTLTGSCRRALHAARENVSDVRQGDLDLHRRNSRWVVAGDSNYQPHVDSGAKVCLRPRHSHANAQRGEYFSQRLTVASSRTKLFAVHADDVHHLGSDHQDLLPVRALQEPADRHEEADYQDHRRVEREELHAGL